MTRHWSEYHFRMKEKIIQQWELYLYHLADNDTLSVLQRACSSVTISVQGKAVSQCSTGFIRTTVCTCPGLRLQYPFQPLDGPFGQEIYPLPASPPLLPLSSSLPTKWMTAFRNTRVRHDSEVHMLCHLRSTCFDASAAREAQKHHACSDRNGLQC